MRREVLVGREVELVELTALLDRGQLVTLTGPGGVGKTTLAVELASSHTDRRVVFVDLAGVEEPSGVEPAVAAAMGQQWFGSIDASTFPDEALVVVDNCEHVLDAAAAAITELRTVLRGLTVCATSRVPLGLRDEFVVPIAPLGVPARELVDAHAPAVELFAAVAARAGAPIADDDLAAVCELCRRVDGIPLAIEIVATRTRSMSVAELLERLGDRLDTIGQGGFRRDERQRSVRDTVEWSYHLLDPHERRLFDRLGVHPGRFSAAMAHTVADDGPFDDTLDRLDRLVGTSLAVATRGADGATWYHQLHAVRACALDHLVSAGELDVTTERLVDHMVAQARNLAAHTERGWTAETFAAITALLDGFLHALRWAVEHDDSPDRAFELLTVLWGHQSRTDEVLAVGRRVLDRWPTTDHPRWADAAATVATCLWIRRELDDADALVERALPGADTAAFAPVLLRRVRGQVRREQGRVDDALASLSDAADAARHRGLTALVVDAELLRAALSTSVGDVDGALAICSRVRELAADGPIAEVLVLTVEADALLRTDPAAAVELARTGRELATRTSYSAAAVGFGRTSAIGLALTGDLPGAASELSRASGR
ncbi:MAG: AAA family ATPase [Actinomycetota bacterium]|nr:AAA family ATPase [Actinomycetota bacterium]